MHRSGTSAITRGLQVMNVEFGDRLMPAIEGVNNKGFWEDIDINGLNDEMLSTLDSEWHHLAPISSRDVEFLQEKGYCQYAVELLAQKVRKNPIFGFKDPRVAKLLPFWQQVFSDCQFEVNYVLILRHPLSVVNSLAKRDDFDIGKSYLLWLGHVIASLAGSIGNRRILIDYDLLMQSPDRELCRIAKEFDLKIDADELHDYKTEFLDQDLRHTIYDLKDLSWDDVCPPLVREIYVELFDVASGKLQIDDIVLQEKVKCWTAEFNRLKSVLIMVDRLFTDIAKHSKLIVEQNRVITQRDAEIRALYTSHSWQLTQPLRFLAQFIRNPRSLFARFHQ